MGDYLACCIINHDYSISAFVISIGDCSESFLACCVPLKRLNFKYKEGVYNLELEILPIYWKGSETLSLGKEI